MAGITLITGGAVSGKSRWAISYFRTCDNVLYISTSPTLPADTRNRLDYSNRENDVKWEVIENVTDIISCIKDHKFFILDNLEDYVTKIIQDSVIDPANVTHDEYEKVRSTVVNNVIECMNRVVALNGAMVIITVEPGFCPNPADSAQKTFRDIMGAINQRIANTASDVYLSVSGIQFRIK